eukprot:jgi/Chlat1/8129/Chrsp75S07561
MRHGQVAMAAFATIPDIVATKQAVDKAVQQCCLEIETLARQLESVPADDADGEHYHILLQLVALRQTETALRREETALQRQNVMLRQQELRQKEALLLETKQRMKKNARLFVAMSLLGDLNVVIVNGNDVDPIKLPDDCPQCDNFDACGVPNDNAAATLLQHHQQQLMKFGVPFGRDGYQLYNVHGVAELQYSINAGDGKVYSSTVDGCIAPYALINSRGGSMRQCRIAYMHNIEGCGAVMAVTGCLKGQALISMLGAYAANTYPLMLDITDGVVHHLLQMRGDELLEWFNLTPQQAYLKQAHLLLEQKDCLTRKNLRLEDIPEHLQRPVIKVRDRLRPPSQLEEQLDTLLPFIDDREERLQTTLELIADHSRRGLVEVPSGVRAMLE